jgi:hypothetical protein
MQTLSNRVTTELKIPEEAVVTWFVLFRYLPVETEKNNENILVKTVGLWPKFWNLFSVSQAAL